MKQVQLRADHCDLEGAGSWDGDGGGLPPSRDQLGDILQVEVEVWGSEDIRGPTIAVARGGELAAEEAVGRTDARQCRAEGSGLKKMVTPGAKWEVFAHAREHYGVSERRACALVGVSRRVIRFEPTRPDDGTLRQRLRELVSERRRFGYRRLGYLLAREGLTPNTRSCCASTARRACGYVAVAAGNGRWARADRRCCRMVRTSAGRSTSSPTA